MVQISEISGINTEDIELAKVSVHDIDRTFNSSSITIDIEHCVFY